jgi:hypothetical protein
MDKLSAIATHLYVRLRRDGGRVIDAIWMTHNQDYAHEVLRIARSIPDDEVARLADRYEELMFGVRQSGSTAADSRASDEARKDAVNPSVAGRYRGALR